MNEEARRRRRVFEDSGGEHEMICVTFLNSELFHCFFVEDEDETAAFDWVDL